MTREHGLPPDDDQPEPGPPLPGDDGDINGESAPGSGSRNGRLSPDEIRELRIAEVRKAHERGWAMVPLDGKVPSRKGWSKAPKPPRNAALTWAEAGNIGLRTGPVSGIVVLDDDTEDGSGVAGLNLPPTVTVVTGSGRSHYYFRCPEGRLTNSPGNLPKGVDVRGDGGQAVFVGSVHPETGQPYLWLDGHSPDDLALADLPDHVLDLIRERRGKADKPPKREKRRRPVALDQGAREALDRAAANVASEPEGSRNDTLNTEAFCLARWVASGLLDYAEVEDRLVAAAMSAGLPEDEARRTVRSGLDAGTSQPLRMRKDGASDTHPPTPGSTGDTKGTPRMSIILEGGALPKIVQQAEKALITANVPFYQRGNQVVRIMRAPPMTMRDIYRRTEGILMLGAVDQPYLVETLTRIATWLTFSERKNELVVVDCPERVARTYLSRAGHWKLKSLLGVVETPTLRPDGSILHKLGYDPGTGLYFDPGAVAFPPIPESPTLDDAHCALDVILTVLKDFPWLEASDRSAAIAAILTGLIRPSLRTAPLFAFRAPKMASGKSLLADVVAMTATGRVASVMSQGKDEDEDKKRMLAILMEGIPVACIDNIERDFGGAALCSVLTQESYRDRILGKTGTATVPTATTWLATGNNIRFVGDIVTRVVVCDLDAGVEKPEERTFDVNLHEYVPAHRADIVVAGLTILRAFHVADRPSQGLSVFGRFEEWSGWIRSAVVWLDQADPCAGRARLYHYDPVSSLLKSLLTAWERELGGGTITTADAVKRVSVSEGGSSPLYESFMTVAAGPGGKPDSRRLGSYLAKYERRLEAGLRIERCGERQGMALWRVHRVENDHGGGR